MSSSGAGVGPFVGCGLSGRPVANTLGDFSITYWLSASRAEVFGSKTSSFLMIRPPGS